MKRSHLGLFAGATVLASGFIHVSSGAATPNETRSFPSSSGDQSSRLKPAWKPAVAAPGETVYEGVGVRTRPAPPRAVVNVSRGAALLNDEVQSFVNRGLAPGTPTVELRFVQTGDFPLQKPSAPRLAWVLTYADSPMYVKGKYVPGHATAQATKSACTLTLIVDAETGELPAEFQTC